MMEESKPLHLDKLVGVPTHQSQKKMELEKVLKDRFNHSKEKYKEELEKTATDLLLIDFAQKAVDEILGKFGRTNIVEIPPQNIHIFKKGGVWELTHGKLDGGAHSTLNGDFIVDKIENNLDFVLVIFHELVHAKCFNAAQLIKEEGEERLAEYRSGFAMTSRDNKVNYFEDVNEAIVGLLTKKFFEDYVRKSELFKKEIEKIDEENIEVDTTRQKEVTLSLKYIDELYKRNKDKYSREEIVNMFLDAGINGNLFKVGRLIESTFGKGSFRELGRRTGYKLKKY